MKLTWPGRGWDAVEQEAEPSDDYFDTHHQRDLHRSMVECKYAQRQLGEEGCVLATHVATHVVFCHSALFLYWMDMLFMLGVTLGT